jgi:hypothetical protein
MANFHLKKGLSIISLLELYLIAPKVPTVIKYDAGSSTSFQWGYEVSSLEDKITGRVVVGKR